MALAPAERPCPVCGAATQRSAPFLDENIDASKLSAFSFASRKVPEYMNHRLVRCLDCDVVYVPSPPAVEELARAYHVAEYDSSDEADDAAAAYVRAITPVVERLPQRRSALEIGTGTGIFLERLKAVFGFSEVVGVEPSRAAIAAAPIERRAWIREGIFIESDFAPGSFDLICCFMTMEHVADPGVLMRSARRLLRNGGAFVVVVHDYRGLVNRVLGKRSPIIDVEHMQLFSKASIARLFGESGYREVSATTFTNRYALSYWLRLAPVPEAIKNGLARFGRRKVSANVGNTVAWGLR